MLGLRLNPCLQTREKTLLYLNCTMTVCCNGIEQAAYEAGLATRSEPPDVEAAVRQSMYAAQPSAADGMREVKPPATVLDDPGKNKDTAFSEAERTALGLIGLLPPKVFTLDEQARLAMHQFAQIQRPLDRYVFLMALQVCTRHRRAVLDRQAHVLT